jgi:hypothetical protein
MWTKRVIRSDAKCRDKWTGAGWCGGHRVYRRGGWGGEGLSIGLSRIDASAFAEVIYRMILR